MKTHWFTRCGWIYRPVHPLGYFATLLALAFCVQTFVAIDRHSHSVSDTLYHFYPFVAPTFLSLMWLAAHTSRESSL